MITVPSTRRGPGGLQAMAFGLAALITTLDQAAKADAAHRRFTHPDSDFLPLLAIWESYHDEFEAMTLGKLRKF